MQEYSDVRHGAEPGQEKTKERVVDLSGKDLNLMVALRALLEEANVTRAGDRIQMGQSSMSSALSRLRLLFADELLVRVGRDYELTPLARLLLPQVQLTLPLIENALGSGEPFDPRLSHRTFKLLMSDYAMVELNLRLSEVLEVAQDISIEILPLPPNPTESEYSMTVNDFVIAVPGIGIEGESRELFTDHYVCLLDAGNPAIANGTLSWEDFTRLPHAVCDFGRSHLTPADRRLHEKGFVRRAHVSATSFLSLPQVVSGTDMVAVIPSRLAARTAAATGTLAVAAPFGKVAIMETLYWHPSHSTDAGHAWLRYCLENREAPVPTRWPCVPEIVA